MICNKLHSCPSQRGLSGCQGIWRKAGVERNKCRRAHAPAPGCQGAPAELSKVQKYYLSQHPRTLILQIEAVTAFAVLRHDGVQALKLEQAAAQSGCLHNSIQKYFADFRASAKRGLRTGQLALSRDDRLAYVLSAADYSRVTAPFSTPGWSWCSGCGEEFSLSILKVCSACKGQRGAPLYCTRVCQKKDWRRHKPSCRATLAEWHD